MNKSLLALLLTGASAQAWFGSGTEHMNEGANYHNDNGTYDTTRYPSGDDKKDYTIERDNDKVQNPDNKEWYFEPTYDRCSPPQSSPIDRADYDSKPADDNKPISGVI